MGIDISAIDHLSPSQAIMFMECPRLWWFKYIQYPTKFQEDTWALFLGTLYHESIQRMFQQGVGAALEHYDLKCEERVNSTELWAKNEVEIVRSQILSYAEEIFPVYEGRTDKVELEINDFRIRGVGVPIHMRIDWLGVDGTIVDHKTVGRKFGQPIANLNFQLLTYGLWYYRKYGDVPTSLELHKAYKDGSPIRIDSFVCSIDDLLEVEQVFIDMWKMIEAGIFPTFDSRKWKVSNFRREYLDNLIFN